MWGRLRISISFMDDQSAAFLQEVRASSKKARALEVKKAFQESRRLKESSDKQKEAKRVEELRLQRWEARKKALHVDMAFRLPALDFNEISTLAEFCIDQDLYDEEFEFLDANIFASAEQLSYGQRGALIRYARAKKIAFIKEREEREWQELEAAKKVQAQATEVHLKRAKDYGDELIRESERRRLHWIAEDEHSRIPVQDRLAVAELLSQTQPRLWQRLNWVQRLALTKKCMSHTSPEVGQVM